MKLVEQWKKTGWREKPQNSEAGAQSQEGEEEGKTDQECDRRINLTRTRI